MFAYFILMFILQTADEFLHIIINNHGDANLVDITKPMLYGEKLALLSVITEECHKISCMLNMWLYVYVYLRLLHLYFKVEIFFRVQRGYTMAAGKDINLKIRRGRQSNGMPNPVDVHVGRRVHLRRKALGLSQNDVSVLLGITFQQIQKYESGTNRISASRLWDFSRILGVNVQFFYEDMPSEIAEQSPRMALGSNTRAEFGCPASAPENTTEGQELLHYYFGLENRRLAYSVLELLKACG